MPSTAAKSRNRVTSLFRRDNRRVADFAMIQPQRAIAKSSAPQRVGDKPDQPSRVDRTWQSYAYDYVEQIGALGYVQHLRANAVAACELRPAELVPGEGGGTTAMPTSDPRVRRVLDAFVGPRGGQAELKRRAALHFGTAGETYLVGTPADTDGINLGILWEFLSTEELRIDAGGRVARKADGTTTRDLGEDCYVARGWRSDARFSDRADSEMRRVLNDCAEIVALSRMIQGGVRSRLPHGLLFVPDEMTFSRGDDETGDLDDDDGFIEELFKHLTEPVEDPGAAATLVPLVLRGKGEHADKLKLVELTKPLDDWMRVLRSDALARLIRGLDISPEIVEGKANLSGLGGGNVAGSIDNDFVFKHVVPIGELLADFLTYAYLRPMLEEFEGMSPEESARYVLEFDPSGIISNDDEAGSARALHDRDVISDVALVRANGFDEGDMPDDDELRRRIIMRLLFRAPQYAPQLLPHLPGFENLVLETPPDLDLGDPARPRDVVDTLPGDGPLDDPPPAPTPGEAPAAIVERLATFADAALERAYERATTRLVSKAAKDPSLRDRLANRRGEALALVSPGELAALGLSARSLLEGAWDRFDLRARAWIRAWIDPYGGPDVDERAAHAAAAMVERLDAFATVNLHRALPLQPNGLRVPVDLIENALSLVGQINR